MFWGLFSEQLYLILVLFLLQDLLVKRQCPLVAGMSLFLTENLQERLIVMLCAISYHLCNFKNVKKHPWRSVTFSTKSNTPPWVFFMFFKLHKWYQIAQRIKFEILQQASPWLGINFNMLNFNPLTTNFSTFHIETPVNWFVQLINQLADFYMTEALIVHVSTWFQHWL